MTLLAFTKNFYVFDKVAEWLFSCNPTPWARVFVQMEKMRPEFRSGLDALTKYIFERTRPKQLGSLVMTGPMFAGLTQSFLDAINGGAVPTIATSWQVSCELWF